MHQKRQAVDILCHIRTFYSEKYEKVYLLSGFEISHQAAQKSCLSDNSGDILWQISVKLCL